VDFTLLWVAEIAIGQSPMAIPLQKRLHLGAIVRAFWSSLKHDIFDTYRPELHYMRGPGPKWNAKHAASPYRCSPAQCDCRAETGRPSPRAGLWAGAGSANRPDGARAASRYAIHPVPIPPNEDADGKDRTQISRCVGKHPRRLAAYRLPPVLGLRYGGGGRGSGGHGCTVRWWRRTPRRRTPWGLPGSRHCCEGSGLPVVTGRSP
jgi:hypothetical protein